VFAVNLKMGEATVIWDSAGSLIREMISVIDWRLLMTVDLPFLVFLFLLLIGFCSKRLPLISRGFCLGFGVWGLGLE
jgi:hypothetical protein